LVGDVIGHEGEGLWCKPKTEERMDLRNKLAKSCKFYTLENLYDFDFKLGEEQKGSLGFFRCQNSMEFDLDSPMDQVSYVGLDATSYGTWILTKNKGVVDFKMNVFAQGFQKRFPISLELTESGKNSIKLFLWDKKKYYAVYLWQIELGKNFLLPVKYSCNKEKLVPAENTQFPPLADLLKCWNAESKNVVNSVVKQGMTFGEFFKMHDAKKLKRFMFLSKLKLHGKKSSMSYIQY